MGTLVDDVLTKIIAIVEQVGDIGKKT